MRTGKLKNKNTGVTIDVFATTEHPDSHYGIPVWVDENNVAYSDADGNSIKNTEYELVFDTNSERQRIGQELATLREKRGLSARQLAELADIHFSNVGKIERGAYNVSIDILSKICNVLDAELTIREK